MEFVNSSMTNEDVAAKITQQIYQLIGKKPPVSVIVRDGKIYSCTIGESWKEGSTTTVKNKDGTVSYQENYTVVALTEEDKTKIHDAVAANYPQMTEV